LQRLGVGKLERRRIVELGRLLLDRRDDRIAVVTGIAAPHAGRAGDDRLTLGRVVVHALGAHDQARRLLEGAVRRERHEERLEIVRHCRRQRAGGKRHGILLRTARKRASECLAVLYQAVAAYGMPGVLFPARPRGRGETRLRPKNRMPAFARMSGQCLAAATRSRNSSTACCNVPACAVSALDASTTCVADLLVSSIASVTVAMLPASSRAPLAASCTLRPISCVEALCSSTDAAIVEVK